MWRLAKDGGASGRQYGFILLMAGALLPFGGSFADSTTDETAPSAFYDSLFGGGEAAEDQLFLTITTERNILLAETLEALKQDDRIFVDFLPLMEAFGYAIGWKGQNIEGWYQQEGNLFYLDPELLELRLEGEDAPLGEGDIIQRNGQVYVDLELISLWFQIEYRFDEAGQSILLTGNPVPSEGAILRQRVRDTLQITDSQIPEEDWVKSEHGLLGWPHISAVSSSSWNNNTRRLNSNLQTIAEMDLAMSRAKLTTNATTENGLTDVRLAFRRTEFSDQLPYTELSIGDITGYRLVNGADSAQGLGFKISNRPLTAPQILGQESFEGDAPPGWEAEIYRGEALVDFQEIGEDGRYRFDAVPMARGVNDVRIILYGPQGQKREIEERLLADANLPKEGEIRYTASFLREEKTLVGFREKQQRENDPDYGRDSLNRFAGEIGYGLTNQTTLVAGLSQAPDEEDNLRFASLGLRTSYGGNPLSVDYTGGFTDAGGSALHLFTRLPFFGGNIGLTHDEFWNFTGEQNSVGSDFLERESKIFANFPSIRFPVGDKQWSLLNTLTTTREEKISGQLDWEIKPSSTLSTPYGSLTNRLDLDISKPSGESYESQIKGNVSGTHTLYDLRIRTSLDYHLKPTKTIRQTSLDLDYKLDEELSLQSKVSKLHTGNRSYSGSMGLRGQYEFGQLGLSVTGNTLGNRSANLTVSTGLQKDPATGDVEILNSRYLRGGSAVALVFVDWNANGVFDHGDDAMDKVLVKARSIHKYTNEEGLVSLTALPLYKPIEIALDERSIKDPFLAGTGRKVTVALKDGSILPVEFPLVPSGEIEGIVEISGVDEQGNTFHRPVPNAQIELLDGQGNLVTTAVSSFDGSYIASAVPIGSYQVRLSPDFLARMGAIDLGGMAGQQASLEEQGGWVTDVNFHLVYENATLDGISGKPAKKPEDDLLNLMKDAPSSAPEAKKPSTIPEELKGWFE